ncbi:hypothetical protein [Brevundimonas viscosa]|uniref:Uncharacterized protein n=1 Tax=Brevundimonas viscosa TaxID=871741 RepID=A0A1I6NYR7_9CAUL|nr:hypothetical protein [Brevundimonas viscosa]SFS33112.1 hypothetical protein SAMN05192570_0665 [Brevundimonas viscosa]
MIPGLDDVLLAAAGVAWFVTVCLLAYLDLRVYALRQSGDLPPTAPDIVGLGYGFSGRWRGIDIPALYSRAYRMLDGHTRRIVPVVRVTLPLGPVLLLASFLT